MTVQTKQSIKSDVWLLLWVAWLAIAISQVLTFGYGMMVPHIMEDFAIDFAVIGNIGAIASWVGVIATIPVTLLATKTSPRFTLPVIYILFAAGSLMFSLAATTTMLYVGRMISGAAATGLVSCLVVVKIRRVPAERMLNVNSLENFVQPLGQTCGTMLAVQLMAMLGGWRGVHIATSVIMIICAVIYILVYGVINRKDPAVTVKSAEESADVKSKERNPLLQALSKKDIILYSLAYPGKIIIWVGFFFFFPSYFMEQGFTAVQAGIATGLFPVFSALSAITFPVVAQKLGLNKAVLVCSGVVLAGLYFLMLQVPNFALLCIVAALAGYVSYTPVPLFFTNVYKMGMPPGAVQMGISLLLTMVALGAAVGSSMIGALVNSYGLYLGLAVSCATPLWYSVLTLLTRDYSDKAMAKRAAESSDN